MAIHQITLLIAVVVLAIVALVAGWVHNNGNQEKVQRRIRTVLSLVVTSVWIATVVADMLFTGYSVSPLLHGIMGAIVGYFFTSDGLDLFSNE